MIIFQGPALPEQFKKISSSIWLSGFSFLFRLSSGTTSFFFPVKLKKNYIKIPLGTTRAFYTRRKSANLAGRHRRKLIFSARPPPRNDAKLFYYNPFLCTCFRIKPLSTHSYAVPFGSSFSLFLINPNQFPRLFPKRIPWHVIPLHCALYLRKSESVALFTCFAVNNRKKNHLKCIKVKY